MHIRTMAKFIKMRAPRFVGVRPVSIRARKTMVEWARKHNAVFRWRIDRRRELLDLIESCMCPFHLVPFEMSSDGEGYCHLCAIEE